MTPVSAPARHPFARLRGHLLAGDAHPWRQDLPKELLDQVQTPQIFALEDDYEVAARHIVGYDQDGQACYCAYTCTLTDLCCDDEDQFFEGLSYQEELSAWRLHDRRWLLRRAVVTADDPDTRHIVFRCSDRMPR